MAGTRSAPAHALRVIWAVRYGQDLKIQKKSFVF
jgi:hypothetical protein